MYLWNYIFLGGMFSYLQASQKQEKAGPLVPLAVPALPEIKETETGLPAIEHKPEGEQ